MPAQRLGLGFLHGERLDDDDAAVFCLRRQRVPQRERPDLLRQADLVAARMRAERAAAAAEQVDARRAVTGGAGALLPVHLLAGAVDVGPVLHFMRAGAALGQLPDDAAVDQIGARFEAENGVGQCDRAAFLAVEGGDLQLHVTFPFSVPAVSWRARAWLPPSALPPLSELPLAARALVAPRPLRPPWVLRLWLRLAPQPRRRQA